MSTVYVPEWPPASPHASDDEFADASGGVPGGWTEVDHGSHMTVAETEFGLECTQATHAGESFSGIYKAVPSGDYTLQVRVSIAGKSLTDYFLGGIALWQNATSSTGDVYMFYLQSGAGNVSLNVALFAAYNGPFTSAQFGGAFSTDDGPSFVWLRIRFIDSSTTCAFEYSTDGIGWFRVYSGVLGFDPAHVGPVMAQSGTGLNMKSYHQHARWAASDIGNNAGIGGQRISMAHATSGGLFLPEAAPSSAHADDDEFDGNGGAGVPSGFTEYDHGSTTTISEDTIGCVIDQTTHAGDGLAGIYKALPAGAWTITTRVSLSAILAAGPAWGGLGLFESPTSSTGNVFLIALMQSTAASIVRAAVFTAYDTESTTQDAQLGVVVGPSHLWLRMRYTGSGTTYTPEYSTDGIAWVKMTAVNVGYTASHVGLLVNNENNGATIRARFTSYRVIGSDVGYSGLSLGDRVQTAAF